MARWMSAKDLGPEDVEVGLSPEEGVLAEGKVEGELEAASTIIGCERSDTFFSGEGDVNGW